MLGSFRLSRVVFSDSGNYFVIPGDIELCWASFGCVRFSCNSFLLRSDVSNNVGFCSVMFNYVRLCSIWLLNVGFCWAVLLCVGLCFPMPSNCLFNLSCVVLHASLLSKHYQTSSYGEEKRRTKTDRDGRRRTEMNGVGRYQEESDNVKKRQTQMETDGDGPGRSDTDYGEWRRRRRAETMEMDGDGRILLF